MRLFRTVNIDELEDILRTGTYRLGRGNEVKYFYPTLGQAAKLATRLALAHRESQFVSSARFEASGLPDPLPVLSEGDAYVLGPEFFPTGPVCIHGMAQ